MKPIVIYFSAETGKTRKIAEKVAEKLAADLYRYELFAHGLFPDNEVDWLKNNADMMFLPHCTAESSHRFTFRLKPYHILYVFFSGSPHFFNAFFEMQP